MDEKIEQLAKDLKLIKELQASDIYTANYQEARALFSLGYRKETDTAREILTELLKEENLENVYFTDENGGIRNRQVIRIEKIKDLAEKYGVDLGE